VRVLLLNQCFHPDVVPIAHFAADLASALSSRGHSVTVVASRRGYTDPTVEFPARENWRGCSVRRVIAAGLGKRAPWRRMIDWLAIMGAYCLELLRLPRFDLVIAMTHPPMVAVPAALAVRLKGGRLVSWIMDLNPDEAIATGWLKEGCAAAKVLQWLLRFALRSSSLVVVLDRFMRDRIVGKGVPRDRILVVPPWAEDATVHYDASARAELRSAQGWTDKFVVMYAGNLSPLHPLDTLLQAALKLKARGDITFCFAGSGNALPQVQAFAREHGLGNICCLPYQPAGPLLSASDLQIVVMGDAMVGIVHPCKIYNILGVGVPFLHIGPLRNHIADIMQSLGEEGSGYSVTHGDVDAAAHAILDAAERRIGTAEELRRLASTFSQSVLIPEMIGALETAAEEEGVPAAAPISCPYES
jgi:colanic acid biosynthesis glycosyl transferase WcaI